MPERDSIDKIVTRYLSAVARDPFTYEGTEYRPKKLIVSPGLLRGYTCPPVCGGCGPRFSLDYLPGEATPAGVSNRYVEVNGRPVPVLSDMQSDHDNHHCRHLRHDDGRCGIHGKHPFSCDFELIRPLHYEDHVVLTSRLFGRGWNMLRVDGEHGARCDMLPATKESMRDVERKLMRLRDWADHFGIRTRLTLILAWVREGGTRGTMVLR